MPALRPVWGGGPRPCVTAGCRCRGPRNAWRRRRLQPRFPSCCAGGGARPWEEVAAELPGAGGGAAAAAEGCSLSPPPLPPRCREGRPPRAPRPAMPLFATNPFDQDVGECLPRPGLSPREPRGRPALRPDPTRSAPLRPPRAAGPLSRPCAAGLAGARPGRGTGSSSSGGGGAGRAGLGRAGDASWRGLRPGRGQRGAPAALLAWRGRGPSAGMLGGDELACSVRETMQHSKTSSERGPRWSVVERMNSKKHHLQLLQTGIRKSLKRFVFSALNEIPVGAFSFPFR